jgi:hypothetical protein
MLRVNGVLDAFRRNQSWSYRWFRIREFFGFVPDLHHNPGYAHGVTRLEVIDHRTNGKGRLLTIRPCSIEVSLQDEGQTLKIFVDDSR